ncbi:hypothetical protein GCM10008959_25850 [Deinococcus seoulensis]|uniref:Uncharacterized protein n=1 Tax=Deinococcus seoulensis TaxID=1837379 RepID=A0ABQ2RWN2_9DEIO|nr:hypothetical protein [Deinococcus seoulensis]GGR62647.1 hypothetical protein GCM10008959_25850 [Deinococcus seoulensis]
MTRTNARQQRQAARALNRRRPANRAPAHQQRRLLRVLLPMSPLTSTALAIATGKRVSTTCVQLGTLRDARMTVQAPITALAQYRCGGYAKQAVAPSALAFLVMYRKPAPLRPQAHLIALSELVDGTFRDCGALMLNRPQTPAQALAGAA